MARGRNKKLIEKRDEKLLCRYHYWTEVQRLRFDDALKVLSEQEFFISEETIIAIIRKKGSMIPDLLARPLPKAKSPRLTAEQLTLFKGD